ncbi:hypothetical protein BFX80_10325 [Cobetia marina]|nr:hypothetical protein BFX80_10325 [Cobetia marina]
MVKQGACQFRQRPWTRQSLSGSGADWQHEFGREYQRFASCWCEEGALGTEMMPISRNGQDFTQDHLAFYVG